MAIISPVRPAKSSVGSHFGREQSAKKGRKRNKGKQKERKSIKSKGTVLSKMKSFDVRPNRNHDLTTCHMWRTTDSHMLQKHVMRDKTAQFKAGLWASWL